MADAAIIKFTLDDFSPSPASMLADLCAAQLVLARAASRIAESPAEVKTQDPLECSHSGHVAGCPSCDRKIDPNL